MKETNPVAKKAASYRMGIDLGGTKILAAVIGPDGAILGMAKKKTRDELGQDGVIKRMVDTAN